MVGLMVDAAMRQNVDIPATQQSEFWTQSQDPGHDEAEAEVEAEAEAEAEVEQTDSGHDESPQDQQGMFDV